MALSLEQPANGTVVPLSRREFDELTSRGVLDDARVELLYGRVVSMSPQGGTHSYGVTELARALVPAVGRKGRVRIQMPLAVSDSSEPEPDIAIVPPGDYLDDHPTTAWLVIEVADSSLESRSRQGQGVRSGRRARVLDRELGRRGLRGPFRTVG